MEGYVKIHEIVDRRILVSIPKYRIYVRIHRYVSEGFFQNGQSALEATFALMASLSPPHIDHILDMRFGGRWPHDILQKWKRRVLEILSMYPQVYVVAVAKVNSSLSLGWKEFFDKYSNRIVGTFETPEEAEAFFDKLRNVESSLSSGCSENLSLGPIPGLPLKIGLRQQLNLPSPSREKLLEFLRLKRQSHLS